MKTHLRLLYRFLFLWLLCGTASYAQINYSEDFEEVHPWSMDENFQDIDELTCSGDWSFMGNFWNYFEETVNTAETISPSIGTSNGLPVTLSYSYKLLDYNTGEPFPNTPNWGSIQIQYGTSASGPWNTIQTLTPGNHNVSANCVSKSVVFTPPAGAIFLRVFCEPGLAPDEEQYVDVLLFLDDVNAVQASSVCAGAPSASTTVASQSQVCTTSPVNLSLGTSYANFGGITYQWQSSADGVAFTNVSSGGTSATYSAIQTSATWYRAVVTCTESTQSTTSTPVQVGTTGAPCYCNVEFSDDIEPITLVNFAGINNTSSAIVNGTPGLQDFTALTPGQVVIGQTYPITVKGNTAGNFDTHYMLYIDFNHNGELDDTGESFQIGIITNSTGTDALQATANIAIPSTAMTGQTRMRVLKLFTDYAVDPCSSAIGLGYGQAEDYTLNISCGTVAPTADAEQSFCPDAATVAGLTATGTGTIVWYADETGGTPLTGATTLVDGETYYAAQVVGCESDARTEVTVSFIEVTVDDVDDVVSCGEYTLPALVNGAYYTETGGAGDMLEAGDIIAEDATIYIYAESGGCSAESSFMVTIPLVLVDTLEDVEACDEYELPAHDFGTYYTEPGGMGTMLETGAVITETTTIYLYSESGTTPNCTAETSFEVTINSAADLDGEASQTFVEGATVADLVVISEDEAVVAWYASEEDAEEGENALETTEVLEDGIYYATQQVGDCMSDPFAVTVDVTLGVSEFDNSKLVYHPNPVSNELNISYSSDITSVEVYNFLGQQVMAKTINQTDAKIDMSLLASGTYMVKINAETGFTTVKVIKN